jgi:predicted pyridoxine 5'-phosphate oxidase superfamily flavin-nucleotide-binding protein
VNEPDDARSRVPSDAPFHEGEVALQERAGVRDRIADFAPRFIRDAMPDQHRELFERLPTLFVGSIDGHGRLWASILAGARGFLRTPDARHLAIDALPWPGDPLHANLAVGAPLGLLGIEPHTRRRNRMNGTVTALSERGFSVQVDQSFGNCPQYIQARRPTWVAVDPGPRQATWIGAALPDPARDLVVGADTFFIASAAAQARGYGGARGADVSHRGGKPGFVRVTRVADRTVLTAPDFRGNFLFNTLGNIAVNPRAGLLFVDYARGDVLQLTGTAEVIWDGPEVAAFAGAQRLLRVTVDEGRWHAGALPLRWSAPEQAPQLAATGTWT